MGSKLLHDLDVAADSLWCLATIPDGSIAALGDSSGQLHILSLEESLPSFSCDTRHGRVNSVALSHDGSVCITCGDDELVKYWDLSERRCKKQFAGHNKQVWDVAVRADGECALSGSWDGTAKIWSIRGTPDVPPRNHSGSVISLAVDDKDESVLSVDDKGEVRIWNSSTLDSKRVLDNKFYFHICCN